MQTRSLVHSRPQRNLLLLIDGKKPEDQLLASVTGIGRGDLATLRDLGLIASSDASIRRETAASRGVGSPNIQGGPISATFIARPIAAGRSSRCSAA